MRRMLCALLALMMVVSLPLTALAQDYTASDFDDLNTAFGYAGEDPDVNIKIENDIDFGNASLTAKEDKTYNINGNGHTMTNSSFNGSGDINIQGATLQGSAEKTEGGSTVPAGNGLTVSGDVTVNVTGSITGGGAVDDDGGAGVIINDNGDVTVSGDITGGASVNGTGGSGATIDAGGYLNVTQGNITGGESENGYGGAGAEIWSGGLYVEDGDVIGGDGRWGGDGINNMMGIVEINGNVIGGDGAGEGTHGGYGAVNGPGEMEVTGDVIGGNAAGEDSCGGAGVINAGDMEVGGDIKGGNAEGENSVGGVGVVTEPVLSVNGGGSLYVGEDAVGGMGDDGDRAAGIRVTEDPDKEVSDYSKVNVNNTNGIEIFTPGPEASEMTREELEEIVTIRSEECWTDPDGSADVEKEPSADAEIVISNGVPVIVSYGGYSEGSLWRGGYRYRTLFKVENGAGMKPVWSEEIKDGILTITVENEPVVFTTWLGGLKCLADMGIKTIVIQTENCETALDVTKLIAENAGEYILTQEGETATLTLDGKAAEIQ